MVRLTDLVSIVWYPMCLHVLDQVLRACFMKWAMHLGCLTTMPQNLFFKALHLGRVSWGGGGIYNFPTAYLTPADCSILDVNQCFNNDNKDYYTQAGNAAVTAIHAVYDAPTRTIQVSGRYKADVGVTSVLYYNDPNVNNEGTGTNKDYNAITWRSDPIGADSFYVDIPIDEFFITYPGNAANTDPYSYPYELKVKTVHENGNVYSNIYHFTFDQGTPVINFSMPFHNVLAPKSNMSIVATNGDQLNAGAQAASKAIDGDIATYWCSKSAVTYPHELVVDNGAEATFVGWGMMQRLLNNQKVNNLEVSVSTDGTNFTASETYALNETLGIQYHAFSSPKTFRYIKFNMVSGHDDNSNWATMGEINLYLDPTTLPVSLVNFNATPKASVVVLNWSTASEQNSNFFEILRYSSDKKPTALGRVFANGNSNSLSSYHFTDYNPLQGTSYYQLKQYDLDGTLATTSDMRTVTLMDTELSIEVKHIATNNVDFDVNLAQTAKAKLIITDMLGQRLIKEVLLKAGSNSLNMPLKGKGLLLLTVKTDTQSVTKKIVN